jgi:hypothetical protein
MFPRIFSVLIFVLLLNYSTPLHAVNKWWIERDKSLANFGEQLAKKNGMKCLKTHVGSIVDSKIVAWDISLLSDQQLTIEQARPMVVAMIKDFWKKVNDDPSFDNGLKELHKTMSWYSPELTPKRLGIRIAFWDKDVNRPLPPYISQIKVLEGRIEYYQANPKDQSLLPPYIETFEQALKLIDFQILYQNVVTY